MFHPKKESMLAVIINASNGIGYELAKLFARDGFDLLLVSETPAVVEVAQVCRNLGTEVEYMQLYHFNDEGLSHLFDKIMSMQKKVHTLIFNLDFNLITEKSFIAHNLITPLWLVNNLNQEDLSQIIITAQNGIHEDSHKQLLKICTKTFLKNYCFGLTKQSVKKNFFAFTFFVDDLLGAKKNSEELARLCLSNLKHAIDKKMHVSPHF